MLTHLSYTLFPIFYPPHVLVFSLYFLCPLLIQSEAVPRSGWPDYELFFPVISIYLPYHLCSHIHLLYYLIHLVYFMIYGCQFIDYLHV